MKNNLMLSDFYCVECAHRGITIPRNKGQKRESGHLKKMYCIHCKRETNHVEVRENSPYTRSDFLIEYTLGRFVDGKRIEKKDLIGCSFKECHYNMHGQCWNANKSHKCGHRRDED